MNLHRLASALVLVAACGSSSSSGAPPATANDAGDTTDSAADSAPDSATEAGTKLAGDLSKCPGTYATTAPVAGLNTGFTSGGQAREFYAKFPAASSAPAPLFIAFNGTGEDGPEFYNRAKLDSFVQRGFVVIAPSSAGNGKIWAIWDSLRAAGDENLPNADIDYVDALLACVAAHTPIDKNRIYVGGHSAGGIFTNNLIQRRSDVYAGAIVASGIFGQTSPAPVPTLDKMLVLVTTGGDNDEYSGSTGGQQVSNLSFLPEAAAASKFYASQTNVGESYCKGHSLGHVWLDGLNDWMIDVLLAHPKGQPEAGKVTLPALPANPPADCSNGVLVGPAPTLTVTCPAGTTKADCQQTCQLAGDCAVVNSAVGPVLATELTAMGFSGADNTDCTGCVSHCEATATQSGDDAVLACFKAAQGSAACTDGIAGAMPFISAINSCCEGQTASGFCADLCATLKASTTASGFVKQGCP